MAGFSTFQFTASTINGAILQFPQLFYLRCNLVIPIKRDIVRQFDGNECIVARKVFLVMYQGQLLGSTDFCSMDEFLNYRNASCFPKPPCCGILYNGCYLTFNGQKIGYGV